MTDRTKFLDGSSKRVVLGLFKEFARCDVKFKPVFTLQEVKELFLDCRDPSEYSVAMELLGDWEHWLEVRNHVLIKPHVDKWQAELAVKLRSEAIMQMKQHAKKTGLPVQGLAELIFRPYDQTLDAENNISIGIKDK